MSTANDRQVGGTHYQSEFQHWDLAWALMWGHFPSAISKYGTRHRTKNGKQDVEKAAHYAEKYAEVIHDTETPFLRECIKWGMDGDHDLVATPDVTTRVGLMVNDYIAANALPLEEAQIIMLLAYPHDVRTVRRIEELLQAILRRDYGSVTGRPAYAPDSDDTEDRGRVVAAAAGDGANIAGAASQGYVNQDRVLAGFGTPGHPGAELQRSGPPKVN